MRLTLLMRQALNAANHPQGLRIPHGVERPGDPHPNTLRALIRHGLLEHHQTRNTKAALIDVYEVTPAGEEALNPKPKPPSDQPRFLRRGGGYTSVPAESIDFEHDEFGRRAIDVWTPAPVENPRLGEDPRTRARRLSRTAKRAA